MFGVDSKVSFHKDGQCQWSLTSEWVKKDNSRKNSERHIVSWKAPRTRGNSAQHIFRVHIPVNELKIIYDSSNLKNVNWIEPPATGQTITFKCYLTTPSHVDRTINGSFPYPVLASMRLRDGNWFIVEKNITAHSNENIQKLREQVYRQCGEECVSKPEQRFAAFLRSEGVTRGLFELCALPP
jgi:hypothetical protein